MKILNKSLPGVEKLNSKILNLVAITFGLPAFSAFVTKETTTRERCKVLNFTDLHAPKL